MMLFTPHILSINLLSSADQLGEVIPRIIDQILPVADLVGVWVSDVYQVIWQFIRVCHSLCSRLHRVVAKSRKAFLQHLAGKTKINRRRTTYGNDATYNNVVKILASFWWRSDNLPLSDPLFEIIDFLQQTEKIAPLQQVESPLFSEILQSGVCSIDFRLMINKSIAANEYQLSEINQTSRNFLTFQGVELRPSFS